MTDEIRLGALYLLLGEGLLAIMGAIIKHLSDDLSTEQIVFFRNIAGLIVLLPLLLRAGLGQLKTRVWHWHLMRGLVGVTAMYCYFWALGHLPLTEAFLVKLSAPLFMPFLAWWWLREPAGRYSWIALLTGFAGVAVILRPGGEHTFTIAAIIGLLGAVLAALAKVTIRRMSVTESSQRIVFYFALISAIVSAPGALLTWQPIPLQAWFWIAALGLVATTGQLALTKAYRIAPTGKVGVYVYSAVIYGALMGWWFWDEIPAWTTAAGAALIITAGIINLRGSRKPKSPA
ncbi:MAG: EamA family transporter [Oceanospirillaceae bacterium]|nr:EamA family transporter [Oceanospirillaceae bacterium]MBT14111.1 EamA family transporter [Oceanospirillaceae bacterium]|tara:strand:- start:16793 stop:17659 length:867 start_codon:yes stop_codon:yes gene_type:complete